MSRIYFLIGGARSGKSEYSEKLAASISEKVAYLATAVITDDEMKKRIEYHQERRPQNWRTFEIKKEIIETNEIKTIFERIKSKSIDVVLIDCITNLLFRLIYDPALDNLEIINNDIEMKIEKKVASFFMDFLQICRESDSDLIIVSNEVGLGVVPSYPFGRLFRDMMGVVNKMIAASADEVYFFTAGLKQRLK